MTTNINISNTGSGGIILTPDPSGVLALQGGGSTGLTIYPGSVTANNIIGVNEKVTISATAATGTINLDVGTQSTLYYTTNATANWTINFRYSSGATLDSVIATGQAVTATFLATQGNTAYFSNTVTIDSAAATVKWQSIAGIPIAGSVNSVDGYFYTLVKTANSTFTVLGTKIQFK